jgi:hypothetical protein
VVNPADEHAVKLGGPNDEARRGHPLYGTRLRPYAAHTVVNSLWIMAQEQINSVHPMHRGGWHQQLNHYLFCFHDSTFECWPGMCGPSNEWPALASCCTI